MADDDGFRVVKKSKGRKHRNNRDKNGSLVKSRNISTSYDSEKCDVNELKTKIEKCRQAKVYFFYESFVFRLDDVLKMKVLHVYFTESRYFIY